MKNYLNPSIDFEMFEEEDVLNASPADIDVAGDWNSDWNRRGL